MVVLAQDVEIRDRLAQSQINKFLYQYMSESMPKQTHANMVSCNAAHYIWVIILPVYDMFKLITKCSVSEYNLA